MTYEEARAFAAAGELRNRMKRDPALAIKITEKAIVERDRLKAINAELLAALEVLADHAAETYPHFESHRGQVDLARAHAALAKAKGE